MLPSSPGWTRWEQHTLPCRVPKAAKGVLWAGFMGLQNELGRTHPTPSAETSSV